MEKRGFLGDEFISKVSSRSSRVILERSNSIT